MKNILVPIDFSPPSDQAIAYVMPIAKKFGATVHLLHVPQLNAYAFLDATYVPSAHAIAGCSKPRKSRSTCGRSFDVRNYKGRSPALHQGAVHEMSITMHAIKKSTWW
ncbi:MAG: universal stress protein [Polyangiales bacterium]